jgi:hypothetical protein
MPAHHSFVSYREWKTWKNADGFTTTFRNHLRLVHLEEYERVTRALNLKHSNELEDNVETPTTTRSESFRVEEWVKRLIKWIVVDDQVRDLIPFSLFF